MISIKALATKCIRERILERISIRMFQTQDSRKKIFVQHDEEKEFLRISFDFECNGKNKNFNLRRNAQESLCDSLGRIRLNIAKVINKSTGTINKNTRTINKNTGENSGDESEQFQLKFQLNGTSVEPETIRNIDAWVEGASLELDGKIYDVKTNEPQVASLKLPSRIMKEFIALPIVELSNCQLNNCLFTWYRKISHKERDKLIVENESIEFDGLSYWLKLIESLTYCPVDDDVAHHLKIVCHPSDGKKWGPTCYAPSSSPVEIGPKSCPFEKRHELTKEKFNHTNYFRIVTYNILADLYADSDYSRTVLFSHCPSYALDIDYRRNILLKELRGYNADIICLQEVDRKEFIKTYSPFFQMVCGCSGVFDNKGGQVAEGLAMFYRDDRFNFINSHKITLAKLIDPNENAQESSAKTTKIDQSDLKSHPILGDPRTDESIELLSRFDLIRDKILSNQELKRRFLGLHTVLQTSLLQFKDYPESFVIIANTHLYFAPDADHIRLLQGSICVKYIEFIKEYYQKQVASDAKVSVIFCGDMNSTPDCGLFDLLQSGKVGNQLADWSSNKEEAIEGLEIETNLRFKSAYQNTPYTNYTPGFNGCLDYIYYELDGLSCRSVVPLPDHDDVVAIKGLPSDVFPSDHLALIANLKISDN